MKVLLALIVVPALQEKLTDWLLMHDAISGFTSHPAHGHGSSHQLTLSEQVSGQRKQHLFWVELELEQAAIVLAQLQEEFTGNQIHYWQLPLNDSGII